MTDLENWLILARTPEAGPRMLASLLERFGSAGAVRGATRGALREAGLKQPAISHLHEPDDTVLARDRDWLAAPANHLIPLGTPPYPALLAEIADPPVALYLSGDPGLLGMPQLAIVGSRNPTPSGRETAAAFAAHLARCGLGITSGLAVGVDAAAHEGALEADGATIAVCGTGLDIVYPSANAALAERIMSSGALVSEFPPGTPPARANFPRRNRLISGLSLGTLVVEAAPRSGSLITARCASEQGREVFAIPGSIHNALARGCHRLIRDGAKLVESASDVLEELGPLVSRALEPPRPAPGAVPGEAAPALDPEYQTLLQALGFDPVSIDMLVHRTGLTAEEVSSMLLILELDGQVNSAPGGLYSRTGRRC